MKDEIGKVGVIGAGQMGVGISHVCAASGFDITLVDLSDEILSDAQSTIDKNLNRLLKRGKLSEAEKVKTLEHLTLSTNISEISECDLVIEAATEDEEVKRSIYDTVCPVLQKDAILASNTSSISITRLAAQTDRPERFIGVHFMNPAPLMELIELISGIATDQSVYDTIHELSLIHI